MEKKKKVSKMVKHFYRVLDEGTLDKLSYQEIASVEKALMMLEGNNDHTFDMRFSFPFFFKRFYIVFLFGRDLRKYERKESTFKLLMLSLAVVIVLSLVSTAIILFLYLIKSAFGINIFEHFSFGVWDWFKNLLA
ncbi:MAG: 3-phosphoshikimate 1-carboxyvinyltransferase [Psychromonas sp.]